MSVIKGVVSQSQKFVGVTTLDNLLASGMKRPSTPRVEYVGKHATRTERLAAELRDDVQRKFTNDRKERAEAYARYIRAVHAGQRGGCPPINLYVTGEVSFGPDGRDMHLSISRNALIAIDGETQLEARFILSELEPESVDWPIEVVVWHNCETETARQYLVDVNLYCQPIKAGIANRLDTTGRMTAMINKLCDSCGWDLSEINLNSVSPGKRCLFSRSQLVACAIGYITGKSLTTRMINNMSDEFNNPLPISEEYEFNIDVVADVIGRFAKANKGNENAKNAKPDVWCAAGASLASGQSPETAVAFHAAA